MKNETLKQAGIISSWLQANDISIDEIDVTITTIDGMMIKIKNDGSILKIDETNDKRTFVSSKEFFDFLDSSERKAFDSTRADFKMKIETDKSLEDARKEFDDYFVEKVEDGFAFLTYSGDASEEPETVAVDIKNKYGRMPIEIRKIRR